MEDTTFKTSDFLSKQKDFFITQILDFFSNSIINLHLQITG